MPKPVVTVLGIDITDRVKSLPAITETKEFNFSKITNNTFSFEAENIDGLLGLQNDESIFANTDWYNGAVNITGWQGTALWKSKLIDVAPNYQNRPPTTKITTKSTLYTFKDRKISYTSSTWETPADSFKNICDQEGFTNYDSGSVSQSKSAFVAASCYWKIDINADDGQSFQNTIEKIAETSNSRLYSYLNNLYFRHWTPYNGGASIFIKEKNLRSKPVISNNRNIFYNQYDIGYIGSRVSDTAGIASASRAKYGITSPGEFATGSVDEMIYYKNLTSAQYIGESIIKRGHKNLSTNPQLLAQIACQVDYEFAPEFNLDSYIKLDFKDEDWNQKLFEILSYTINENTRSLTITALEVDV
jgi:hypothetical protein